MTSLLFVFVFGLMLGGSCGVLLMAALSLDERRERDRRP